MHNDKPENGNGEQALEPVEQESILFHEQNIVAVRLADGRICVVLRWICESLKLAPNPQVRRIERTASTAEELVRVKVQTRGGRQTMPAITLRGFTPWVLGLNPNEVQDEDPKEAERIRALIRAYQTEAKDVLYEHFVNKRHLMPSAASAVVPAETPTLVKPTAPEIDAPHEIWIDYHQQMIRWHRWQADIEQWRSGIDTWRGEVEEWRGGIEGRLEGVESMTSLIPEILERLGPQTITPEHHRQVQVLAKQLHQTTGKPFATIYDELKTAFEKPRLEDLLEEDWPQIENWFRVQMERTRKKK